MKLAAGIFLVVLLAGVYGWDEHDQECVEELKLDKEVIKAIYNKDTYPEDNADFNKFLGCSATKDGSIKDGEVNWKKIGEIFEAEIEKEIEKDPSLETVFGAAILTEVLKNCREKKIHGDSDGQTIAKLYNCLTAILTADRR